MSSSSRASCSWLATSPCVTAANVDSRLSASDLAPNFCSPHQCSDTSVECQTCSTALKQHLHRVSEKSSTLYFAEYFCARLTDCKNFNGYRVRDNQRTQLYNQCFNFWRAEVLPPGELTCIKLATVRAQKLPIFWRSLGWSSFAYLLLCIGKQFFLL